MKGPVSHGFQVIVKRWGVFSARVSSDLLNPEIKILAPPEPSSLDAEMGGGWRFQLYADDSLCSNGLAITLHFHL